MLNSWDISLSIELHNIKNYYKILLIMKTSCLHSFIEQF